MIKKLCLSLLIILSSFTCVFATTTDVNVVNPSLDVNLNQPIDVNPVEITDIQADINTYVVNQDELLNTLNALLNTAPLDDAVSVVTQSVAYIIFTLLGVFPIFLMFKKLLIFCSNAFDVSVIRKLEGGGIFSFLNEKDAVIGKRLESISDIKLSDKYTKLTKRRKKG